jgi:hypothetical protein
MHISFAKNQEHPIFQSHRIVTISIYMTHKVCEYKRFHMYEYKRRYQI